MLSEEGRVDRWGAVAPGSFCYQVQALSACHMASQLFNKCGIEARDTILFRKPENQEDGRLLYQNNHLNGVWMLGCFIEQRGGNSEELM